MTKYYYIGTILPSLSFEVEPEISLIEFDRLLRDNLTQSDYRKTSALRRIYDTLNLRAFWLGEELDPWGNYNAVELEEAIVSQQGLPDSIYEFLEAHEKKDDRLRYFPSLLAQAFREEIENHPKGFIHDYLSFEREWRLVFTGFRAKKLGRDLSVELQYENPEEELIAQMLAQKDAKTFEPPEKYQALKAIFDRYADEPLELERALDEYRFNYIDSLIELSDSFSMDRILAYMSQLIILQKWFALDKEKGLKIVDIIVKEIS